MKKLLVVSLLLIGGSSLFGMWRQDSDSGKYANQAPCYGSHFPSQAGPQCPSCFPAPLPAAQAKDDVPEAERSGKAVKVK